MKRGDIRTESATAEIIQRCVLRHCGDLRSKRRQASDNTLSSRLANHAEPHCARHKVGRKRCEVAIKRGAQCHAVGCGGRGETHRIGRVRANVAQNFIKRRMWPRRAGCCKEGRALLR